MNGGLATEALDELRANIRAQSPVHHVVECNLCHEVEQQKSWSHPKLWMPADLGQELQVEVVVPL